ncbi:MAG: hypothetical protein IV100_04610 [Myxococcales bacterium]|nr:hypothetical protein [Myxococcales bacterium]
MRGLVLTLWLLPSVALAYPEFQKFSQVTSGRGVNCAMCHAHPDGPDGVKAGQIGSLDAAALDRLNQARIAFEPGLSVDSPILNAFGDEIIKTVGKKAVLAMRADPAALATAMILTDLDGDGIMDGDEYLDGTHPLDPNHGDPWKLAVVNLGRHKLDLLLLALATVLGLYGLGHILRWFGHEADVALGKGSRPKQ